MGELCTIEIGGVSLVLQRTLLQSNNKNDVPLSATIRLNWQYAGGAPHALPVVVSYLEGGDESIKDRTKGISGLQYEVLCPF